MTPESAIHLIHGALMAAFWMSAPLLAIGLAVGIIMNMVQVATSLQDNAFSTFPRLAAFLVGFSVLMPWMLKQWMSYIIGLCGEIARYGH
jgi:flagellar biosynthesis protein FliQ